MSATWLKGQRGFKRDLLENSLDAYVLALETINRLSVRHRIEAFSYLICNAWELLLKARIIQIEGQQKAIFRPTKRGEPKKTLSLRECLERLYPSDKDPVRRNIERVAEIRDEATHFCIRDIPKSVLAVFQAAVVNYHNVLTEWFGVSISDAVPVGMMTIVFDMSADRFSDDLAVLRKSMDARTLSFLMRQQEAIEEEHSRLGRPTEFAVVFKHELRIEKKPGYEAVSFVSEPDGLKLGVVQVAKRPDISHPHRLKELIQVLNNRLTEGARVADHDIVSVVFAHNIDQRPEFYFLQNVPHTPKQYSDTFADWILERYRQDVDFFVKAREAYRASGKNRPKRRPLKGQLSR